MPVLQTSLDAYNSIRPKLSKKQQEVLTVFQTHGPLTNWEAARCLGWPINTITPRVLELREKLLLLAVGKRRCDATGRWAMVWGCPKTR